MSWDSVEPFIESLPRGRPRQRRRWRRSGSPVGGGCQRDLYGDGDWDQPTGSVDFTDGGASISGCASVALSGSGNTRTAMCSTSSLSAGTHSIVAAYGGDVANLPSSSTALSQVDEHSGTDVVWVDDAVPDGATVAADGGDSWTWINSNPTPYSGSLAHQSALAGGRASALLLQRDGNPDGCDWRHLVCVRVPGPGESAERGDAAVERRDLGASGLLGCEPALAGVRTARVSRRYMGALPAAGQWVRLAVAAALVGLEGRTLNGMAYTLYGGRASWDYAGKTATTTATYQVSGTVTLERLGL